MTGKDINFLLEKLGLTEYESKTLGTLFKTGESEAPAISRLAQVPKTRVYDVLDKLVEKNLVIEIRGRPKRYRGIEAKKACETLLQKKQDELKELEDQAKNVHNIIGPEKEEPGETVMKVKDKHDFEKILAQEISKAQKSLVGFSEITDKQQVLKEAIEKANDRNINLKLLNAYPNQWMEKTTETRQADHGLNAFIVDNKRVILGLSDFKMEKPEYHFTIFHENKPMVNAIQNYFEKKWQEAKK